MLVPTDGRWSDEIEVGGNQVRRKVTSNVRPRIYYTEILDCDRNVAQVFKTGQIPKLETSLHFTTEDGNEFSYEDIGLLKIYFILLLLLGSMFVVLVQTFMKFYQQERSFMAPHPIMMFSLSAQVSSIFF